MASAVSAHLVFTSQRVVPGEPHHSSLLPALVKRADRHLLSLSLPLQENMMRLWTRPHLNISLFHHPHWHRVGVLLTRGAYAAADREGALNQRDEVTDGHTHEGSRCCSKTSQASTYCRVEKTIKEAPRE